MMEEENFVISDEINLKHEIDTTKKNTTDTTPTTIATTQDLFEIKAKSAKMNRRSSNDSMVANISRKDRDKIVSDMRDISMGTAWDLNYAQNIHSYEYTQEIRFDNGDDDDKNNSETKTTKRSSSEKESVKSSGIQSIWGKLSKPYEVNLFDTFNNSKFYDHDDDMYDNSKTKKQHICKSLQNCFHNIFHIHIKRKLTRNLELMKKHRYIPVYSLIFLCATMTISIGTTIILSKKYAHDKRMHTYHFGLMAKQLLMDQMDTTIESLHALVHGLQEDELLQDLPRQIGVYGEDGSAPFIEQEEIGGELELYAQENGYTHKKSKEHELDKHGDLSNINIRDVSGICDNTQLMDEFTHTVEKLRVAACLHGVIIHQITMIPYGVTCLAYPSFESAGYVLGQDIYYTEKEEDHDHHDEHSTESESKSNTNELRQAFEKAISSKGAVFSGPFPMDEETKEEPHEKNSEDHTNVCDTSFLEASENSNSSSDNAEYHSNHFHYRMLDEHEHDHATHEVVNQYHTDHGITKEDHSAKKEHAHHTNYEDHNGHADSEDHHNKSHIDHINIKHWLWKVFIPLKIPGVEYSLEFNSHWGVMEVSVDWLSFVKESGIHEYFDQYDGLEFAISKDWGDNMVELGNTSTWLAYSENAQKVEKTHFLHLFLDYEGVKEIWCFGVGVMNGFDPDWFALGISLSVFISLAISLMFLSILSIWQSNRDLLLEMLPKKVLDIHLKGDQYVEAFDMVTVFFCDIVGYTKLSSQMRPMSVMKMLNDFFAELDKIAARNNVYKVETSKFVTSSINTCCVFGYSI